MLTAVRGRLSIRSRSGGAAACCRRVISARVRILARCSTALAANRAWMLLRQSSSTSASPVGVKFLQALHEVVLPSLQLGDLGLEFGAAVVGVWVGLLGGVHVGEQDLAGGAEDSFGEEPGDGVEEQVFADGDVAGVL